MIADQYIAVTDLKGFTPLVETILDGLHDVITEACHEFGGLTFTDAARALAGLEHLVAAWDAFVRKKDVRCPINVAVHKGPLYAFRTFLHGRDLNVAFGVESATQHVPSRAGIFVTGQVRRDLLGTPWEARLDPVLVEPMPARLKDTEIYRVQTG